MATKYRRHPRHPIAKRLPAERPARAEMNVRRGYNDMMNASRDDYDSNVVCNCFPRPSEHTIPSMFYDKITCPHQHNAHIQPAQETQFNYPWTANSVTRRFARGDDDELSERLSLISEEDDQLRFSPNFLHRKQPDILSIQTAPPEVRHRGYEDIRDATPPYTAPVNDTQILMNGRRAQSMQDIRDPAYRTDGVPRSRENLSPTRSRISNRQFTGSYVDPRSGKVLHYNVNYDGTPRAPGSRQEVPKTTGRKPQTAS